MSSTMKHLQAYEGRATQLLRIFLAKQEPSPFLTIQAVVSCLTTPLLLLFHYRGDWKWKRLTLLIVLVNAWLEVTSNLKFLIDGNLNGDDKFSSLAVPDMNHELDAMAAAQPGQTICYCLSSLLANGEGVSILPIVIRDIPNMLRIIVLTMSILGAVEPHFLDWIFPTSCMDSYSCQSSDRGDKMQLLVDMLVLPFEVRQIPNALKFLGSSSNGEGSKRSFVGSFRKVAAVSLLANYIRVRLSSNLTAAKAVQLHENSGNKNKDLNVEDAGDENENFSGSRASRYCHKVKEERKNVTRNRERVDQHNHSNSNISSSGDSSISCTIDESNNKKGVSDINVDIAVEIRETKELQINSAEEEQGDLSIIRINVGDDKRNKIRRGRRKAKTDGHG